MNRTQKVIAGCTAVILAAGLASFTAIPAAADEAPPEEIVEVIETPIVTEPEVVVEETPIVEEIAPPAALVAPVTFAAFVAPAAVDEPKYNDPAWWAANYAFDHEVVQCYKDSHGTVTNDDKAVTLYPYGADWPGDHYELLVVKAGSTDFGNGPGNLVYEHPSSGTPYFAPTGDNGKVKDVSHWIVCKGVEPEVEPVIAKADWGYTPSTCTTGQSAVIIPESLTNATWTEASLALNGTVGPAEFDIEAVLDEGAEWAEGQDGTFHVILLGPDDSQCPEIAECEVITVLPTSTNVNPQGWTLESGEYVDGGVEFTASNWSDSYAEKAVNFPLSQANDLGFTTTGGNVWAIILVTSAGNVHFEPEPYSDDLWTNAAGILPANGGGQGGPYSGNLDDIVSDPTVTEVQFYFTSGAAESESAVGHSVSFNCYVQPFDYENIETPLPAQFSADPTPPTCGVAGSFDFEALSGQFPHVTIWVTDNEDGSFFLEAETDEGYEFPDGTTYKSRTIVIEGALLYQSEDNEDPCYVEPREGSDEVTTEKQECGVTEVDVTTVTTLWVLDPLTGELVETVLEPVVTQKAVTPTACPGLAFTGVVTNPLVIGGGIAAILAGIALMLSLAWRRNHSVSAE